MLEGLAKERPSVRMQGKEINVEQSGKKLTGAREVGDPGEEMKERQAASNEAKNGSKQGPKSQVFSYDLHPCLCDQCSLLPLPEDNCVHPKWVPNQAVSYNHVRSLNKQIPEPQSS